jgi:hypothetical protein
MNPIHNTFRSKLHTAIICYEAITGENLCYACELFGKKDCFGERDLNSCKSKKNLIN